MVTTTVFWTCFSLTLLTLGAAFVAGLRGARRLHLVIAPLSLALLTVTVLLTEALTSARLFPEQELRIHLWFAKAAGALAILVAVTGVFLWRTGRGRRCHFWCVVVFLVGAVVATGTGLWAFSLSSLR